MRPRSTPGFALSTLASVIAITMLLAPGPAQSQGRVMEGPLEVVPVRGSIHMMQMGQAGNVAVSAGEDGALVIDDQFEPMAPQLIDAVAELTDHPITWVLNTHWHGDHTGSNAAFGRQGYTIVAHDNVRTRMSSDQYHLFFKAGSRPSPPEALPVVTYSETMTFYLNGDVVRVLHVPNAHTDGDSIFYFENADVMHTGDAFINRGYPLVDVASGGSLKGQIEATNRMLELVGPDTIIIPGHGPLAGRARMIEIRDMLVAVREAIVPLIEQGLTLREIKDAKPLAELDERWAEGLVNGRAFVQIVYQSETGDFEIPPQEEWRYAE